jgi:hypothetical protein
LRRLPTSPSLSHLPPAPASLGFLWVFHRAYMHEIDVFYKAMKC